jgi:hypothetical protein
MTITATDLRNKAAVWKRFGDEALSDSNKALYHSAAKAFGQAADDITGLRHALDRCVDGGTFDMVRDALEGLVAVFEAEAQGVAQQVTKPERVAAARAVLAKLKT